MKGGKAADKTTTFITFHNYFNDVQQYRNVYFDNM